MIATLVRNAPHQLIFDEPDIFASVGHPSYLGPMDFPRLVYNIHLYCTHRSPVTGNPTSVSACADQDDAALAVRREDRTHMASRAQPRGPAWFVSEFGATSSSTMLRLITSDFDRDLVGWTYWSWKYYEDPTGSSDEALVAPTGRLRATARVLSRTYAEAVAGIPLAMSFNPTTGTFHLRYRKRAAEEPTLIFAASHLHYPHGYCVRVSGGRVVGRTGSTLVEVANGHAARVVDVTITAGSCPGTRPTS